MNAVALFALLLLQPGTPQTQDQVPPRPTGSAARITPQVTTWDDAELELATSGRLSAEERTMEVRRKTLLKLADEALYMQEAAKYGIEVSEAQVDADIEAER